MNIELLKLKQKLFGKYKYKQYFKSNPNPVPRTLVMELSPFCNLNCLFCKFHGIEKISDELLQRRKFMTWETVEKIASQVKKIETIDHIESYHSGEELMNPDWAEMLKYLLTEKKVPHFTISTNGMLLNEDAVRKINELPVERKTLLVSLHGQSKEECEKYRKNISYDLVKNNILQASKMIDKNVDLHISLDYILDKETIIKDKGVILNNYPVPEYIKEDFKDIDCHVNPTFIHNPQYNYELEKLGGGLEKISATYYYKCYNLHNMIGIDSEGYVLNCTCNGKYIRLGNIHEQDMLEIWLNHPLMKKAREYEKTTGCSPAFCQECAYKNGGGKITLVVKKRK